MGGEYKDVAVYPFRKVYYTDLKPHGGTEAVQKMVDKAFPQLAAILQSGADALGVGPEQISPFMSYKRPATPTYGEAKYAAELGTKFQVLLSGDTDDVIRAEFRSSAKDALKEVGKDLLIDVATKALPAIPGVPMSGLVQVGIQLFENKDLLKTTQGRAQLAKQAGFAVASMIPGIGIGVAAVGAVVTVLQMRSAKESMKEQVLRGEKMMKMIDDQLNAALDEARGLSTELAERRVSLRVEPDSAWTSRLRKHYEELEAIPTYDYNRQLDLEKVTWYAKGSGYVAAHWEERSKFDHRSPKMDYLKNIRLFLQFARDMHKVREALKGTLAPVGSATKSPAEVATEIQQVAAAMLAKDPLMPIQEAINLASVMARGAPQPIGQAEAPAAAAYVQAKATQIKTSSALAIGGGAIALMLGIKFLPMLMKGRN